jgi:beta-lactamase class A
MLYLFGDIIWAMKYIILFVITVIVSSFVGYFIGVKNQPVSPGLSNPYRISVLRKGSNGLINPILDYDIAQNFFTGELKGFKTNVQEVVDKDKKAGKVTKVGVYFRDLQDGPWFGIDEDLNFAPASLLKVPLMIAYYKLAQDDPKILEKKIAYDSSYPFSDQNEEEYFKPDKAIEKGKSYTVEELIEYMILYSDNNAKNILELNIPVDKEAKIYTDLNIPDVLEQSNETANILSVRQNASFYRVLYNASYINEDYSKRALNLLVHAHVPDTFTNGLPKDLEIADKYGERDLGDAKQLHDCGIVYYPKNPYIYCIMTEGADYNTLATVIADVGKELFTEVNNQVHSYKNYSK